MKAQILAILPQLKTDAKRLIQDKRYGSLETSCCFMFYPNGNDFDWKVAISQGLNKQERLDAGVRDLTKATCCAEEVIMAREKAHKGRFWFSLAYDMKYGWKRACNGCTENFLRIHRIIDLADDANARLPGP
jgi:hypothetical protein